LSPIVRAGNQPAPPSLGSSGSSSRAMRDPRLISSTRPVYPSIAKQSGIQGKVVVSAEVGANGNVTSAKAISGPVFLRAAAIDAVKQWKYAPALADGKPASAVVTIDVEFRLN
jgi:protein TonB